MLPTKIGRRDQLTLAFVAITAILLAVAVIGTVNYDRYYPAITQIKLSMASLQKTNSTDTQGNPTLKITAQFKLENPTNYKGFVMKNFETTLDVIGIVSATDNVTVPQGRLPYIAATGSLNQGEIINVVFPAFYVTVDAAKLATMPQTRVQFVFHPDFVLSSFLDRVSLVIPYYTCTSTGDPTNCQQSGITLSTPGGGLGGGGGGGGA